MVDASRESCICGSILILNIWWEQLMIYHMKTTPEPCAIEASPRSCVKGIIELKVKVETCIRTLR